MPTYEYRCPDGHEVERFVRKISDAQSEVECPVCGKVAPRRMSLGGGLLFKGSGFYLTDYGKNAHRGGAPEKGGEKGGAGESGGGESKSGGEGGAKSESGTGAAAPSASGSGSGGGESSSSTKSAESKPAAEPKKAKESKPAPPKGDA
jgi:putative FmdB family regulatory protein